MSKIQKVNTGAAPQAAGSYSQAAIAGNFVFVSGQLPIDLSTQKLVKGDIETMTNLVIDHLEAILKAAGLSLADVVKTDVFLKDLADFQAMNRAYAKRFHFPAAPARVTVQAGKLPMDAGIEISCIACLYRAPSGFVNFIRHLLRPSALLALVNFPGWRRAPQRCWNTKSRRQNSRNLTVHGIK